jgi:hypothetical protein
MAATQVEDRGEAVVEHLVGRTFGSTRVVAAIASVGRDADDDPATWLDLVLTDPRGETWPLEDMVALRREMVEVAAEADIDTVLYVRVKPLSDDVQEDELRPGETPLFET